MDQLGIGFNATGSVMSQSEVEDLRRKRGECLTCGRKCYQKKLFKMIPITDHGNVLQGRCLHCKPLDPKTTQAALPAASRPATREDLKRFSRSQSKLKLTGPGVVSNDQAPPSPPPPVRSQSAEMNRAPPPAGLGRCQSSYTPQTPPTNGNLRAPRSHSMSVPGSAASIGAEQRRHSQTSELDGFNCMTLSERSTASAPGDLQTRSNGRSSPASHYTDDQQCTESTLSMDSTSGRSAQSYGSAPEHSPVATIEPTLASMPPLEHAVQNELVSSVLGKMAAEMIAKRYLEKREAGNTSVPDTPGSTEQDYTSSSCHSFTDTDGFDAEPVHGVLNRGGVVSFPKRTNSNSCQTLSSSSISFAGEEDGVIGSRQRSVRQVSWRDQSRRSTRSLSLEEDDGECSRTSFRNRSCRNVLVEEAEQRGLQQIHSAGSDYQCMLQVMKEHPASAAIQQEALKGLSDLHLSNEDDAIISSLGGLDTVVLAMRSHPHEVEVQICGCRAVWNLSATTENQLGLVVAGALDTILTAMVGFGSNADVQEKALAAIANLAAAEDNQEKMIGKGTVQKVVVTMNKHSEDGRVQEKGCAAISNLASHDTPLKRDVMEGGGGGAVVVSMIMHPEDVDLQETALRAIRNICANCDENKIEVANVGGIDAVITAMQVHRDEPGVQEAGAWALSNLAVNPENKAVIGDCGGIDVVIRAMWVHSESIKVQEWCCRALWTLSVDAHNRGMILEVGGISAIVNAMQAHGDEATVQERACGVLTNLASSDDATKLRIVDEEALDAIVMAMVLHSEHQKLQERACEVLRQLAIEPNIEPMKAANVTELVRMAGEKFPEQCGEMSAQLLSILE